MIHIEAIDHVVLRVSDPEETIRFYRDVLGCPVERTLPPEIGLIQLRAGNALIDLVPIDGAIGRSGGAAPGSEGRNMDHFCVRLKTFDEAQVRAHLASFGISAPPAEIRYGAEGNGPSIYIRDPSGNTVELKGPRGEDSP
ncbi:MAG TPA: VOC family protein [Deltaproteobacteria bacterium]|nr:VOC family protein [Deltaproteobacteria bacterium]